jgi:hypothetical protein
VQQRDSDVDGAEETRLTYSHPAVAIVCVAARVTDCSVSSSRD